MSAVKDAVEMKMIQINVEIPADAQPRAVIVLYRGPGAHGLKTWAKDEGGPTAEQTGIIIEALAEHLNTVLALGGRRPTEEMQ